MHLLISKNSSQKTKMYCKCKLTFTHPTPSKSRDAKRSSGRVRFKTMFTLNLNPFSKGWIRIQFWYGTHFVVLVGLRGGTEENSSKRWKMVFKKNHTSYFLNQCIFIIMKKFWDKKTPPKGKLKNEKRTYLEEHKKKTLEYLATILPEIWIRICQGICVSCVR